MNIPDKYRDRYDALAEEHPWMREMVDETNGIGCETNGIADEITLPEGDAVAILRKAATCTSVNTSVGDVLRYNVPGNGCSAWQTAEEACEALADMVERDYVLRSIFDAVCDNRDEWKRKAEGSSKVRAGESNLYVIDEHNLRRLYHLGYMDCKQGYYNMPASGLARIECRELSEESRSAKRAAAVERLRKCYPSGYFNVLRDAFGWEHGSSHSDKEWRDALIDLLADEPMDVQHDINGTCPDGNETCPNHSKAQSKTEPSLSQLFGILSDDCGQIADMSGKSADCVRSEPEMSEIDEPDTIRNELEDNGYVVMPYHNGEKQAKLRGKEYDQVIFDELQDSREKLEADLQALTERWHDYDGNYMRIYSTVAYAQVKELLDRQASITAKRLCSKCTPTVAEERDYLRTRVDELNTQVQELQIERNRYRDSFKKINDAKNELQSCGANQRLNNLINRLHDKGITLYWDDSRSDYTVILGNAHEFIHLKRENINLAHDLGEAMADRDRFREEISEMLDAAQQIERIRAKHETQLN